MSQILVEQPDGRLAVFSSIVDDLILYDCTEAELVDVYVKQAAERARQEAMDWIAGKTPGRSRHTAEQAVEWVRRVHGDDGAARARERLGMTPFEKLKDLFRGIHEHIAADTDESDEAEALREHADVLWFEITEEEQRALRHFSESLYREREAREAEVRKQAADDLTAEAQRLGLYDDCPPKAEAENGSASHSHDNKWPSALGPPPKSSRVHIERVADGVSIVRFEDKRCLAVAVEGESDASAADEIDRRFVAGIKGQVQGDPLHVRPRDAQTAPSWCPHGVSMKSHCARCGRCGGTGDR